VEAHPPELPPEPDDAPPEPDDAPPAPLDPPLPEVPMPAPAPPEPESFGDDPPPPVPLVDCEPENPQPHISIAHARATRPIRGRPGSSQLTSLRLRTLIVDWGRSVVMIPPAGSVAAVGAAVRKKETTIGRASRSLGERV
jgi:hypothetical protein